MREVVIVEAVRTPIGKRNGGLAGTHPVTLLAAVQKELISRTGIDPAEVGQIVGGCVSQVGEQTMNIARTAWLTSGGPLTVAATTVDAQCGSSQQATNLAAAMVGAGVVDVAIGCGVEAMSRVPMGASLKGDLGFPMTGEYPFDFSSQFQGAELIAQKWDCSREELDAFGLRSQQRAAQAWAEDRFGTQIVPITTDNGVISKDEGPRETTLEKLATLNPVVPVGDKFAPDGGRHTAGSSSQISDGAGAVLMMTAEKASQLGLTPKARIVDTCLVGSDPVMMLTGPIDATRHLMERNKLTVDDLAVTEINEAFASVVVAWEKELKANPETTNPNGGAIGLGHPLGGTGAILMTKAVHELQRTGGQYGLVTMCCGGGLGTGTLIERI